MNTHLKLRIWLGRYYLLNRAEVTIYWFMFGSKNNHAAKAYNQDI